MTGHVRVVPDQVITTKTQHRVCLLRRAVIVYALPVDEGVHLVSPPCEGVVGRARAKADTGVYDLVRSIANPLHVNAVETLAAEVSPSISWIFSRGRRDGYEDAIDGTYDFVQKAVGAPTEPSS